MSMSEYHKFDGDDTYMVIADGIEGVAKCTRRLHSKISIMASRDSPALRQQIEGEYRKGQDQIQEIKAELRGASQSEKIAAARREFRNVCASFKEAYEDYKQKISKRIVLEDTVSEEWGSNGAEGSQQSLTMLIETDDVDAIMEQENREDTRKLAEEAVILRDTMADIGQLIDEGGEQLMTIEQDVEAGADAIDQAAEELTKAREHQKSYIKLKLGIGICCGVTLVVALFIILWRLGVFNGGGSAPSAPTTTSTPRPTTAVEAVVALLL